MIREIFLLPIYGILVTGLHTLRIQDAQINDASNDFIQDLIICVLIVTCKQY